MTLRLVLTALSLTAFAAKATEEVEGPVAGWTEVIFDGRTDYRAEEACLRALSDNAASGLVRRQEVDLTEKPELVWRWRADKLLRGAEADEQSKDGDDFLARVYVVHETLLPWRSRAVNYVWTRDVPVGEHWDNPFAGQAVMVAVQSGPEGLGEWHSFRRDVRADFKRFHDRDIDSVQAVAIMTDTDNTGGRAEACYELPRFAPE
jgi:hypothetical protein